MCFTPAKEKQHPVCHWDNAQPEPWSVFRTGEELLENFPTWNFPDILLGWRLLILMECGPWRAGEEMVGWRLDRSKVFLTAVSAHSNNRWQGCDWEQVWKLWIINSGWLGILLLFFKKNSCIRSATTCGTLLLWVYEVTGVLKWWPLTYESVLLPCWEWKTNDKRRMWFPICGWETHKIKQEFSSICRGRLRCILADTEVININIERHKCLRKKRERENYLQWKSWIILHEVIKSITI